MNKGARSGTTAFYAMKAKPRGEPLVKPEPRLTVQEADALRRLETVIERGLDTFVEVGNALYEIREARLYRKEFGTFEAYCRQRWHMSRIQAHRLIGAAETAEHLLPVGNAPTSERQVRPLTGLEPDVQREVWREAVKTAPPGKVTAQHVEQAKRAKEPASGWTSSQRERKAAVENGRAVVASLRVDHALMGWAQSEGLAVRIDRTGDWGNPYEVGPDGTREQVIAWHQEYFAHKRSLQARLGQLKGKVLLCWCHPEACHGDYLAALANGEKTVTTDLTFDPKAVQAEVAPAPGRRKKKSALKGVRFGTVFSFHRNVNGLENLRALIVNDEENPDDPECWFTAEVVRDVAKRTASLPSHDQIVERKGAFFIVIKRPPAPDSPEKALPMRVVRGVKRYLIPGSWVEAKGNA